MRVTINKIGAIISFITLLIVGSGSAMSQSYRSQKSYIKNGVLIKPDTTKVSNIEVPDSILMARSGADSLSRDSLYLSSMQLDSLGQQIYVPTDATDSLLLAEARMAQQDTLATPLPQQNGSSPLLTQAKDKDEKKLKERKPFISDSMSISNVCWTAAVLPGFGQVYNKQYWKLPILYGTLGAGIALYAHENKTYKPLKAQYDKLLLDGVLRKPELNQVQAAMIKSNTRRQMYLGATLASYIYFLGDAAVNYSTNDVSDVKKATTLAMICPGAGQVYNKSYWRVPFVVGLFATTIYVIDWNNRGYQRFQQAYTLMADYEANKDKYPDGSPDEFGGNYSASYLKGLRNSYRRNRDYAIILTAGVYLLQIIDAHVDAHLKTFDISDDLTFNVNPIIDYNYTPVTNGNSAVYGLNLNLKF